LKLGIIGRNWGSVYARACDSLGIEYWIAGREIAGKHPGWRGQKADGYIIASPPETHFAIARDLLSRGCPVIVEKPVTMHPGEARELARMGGIAYAGHTRLYDPNWTRFKALCGVPKEVSASAGGTRRDPWWDWGPHLVAMCLDLGFDPRKAQISVSRDFEPLSFKVNGYEFKDEKTSPSPIESLTSAFVEAIRKGIPDNRLMPEVVEIVDELGQLHRC
jgi:hypothetical protein